MNLLSYYFFALLALSGMVFAWSDSKDDPSSYKQIKDEWWINRVTALPVFVIWSLIAMVLSLYYGFWIALIGSAFTAALVINPILFYTMKLLYIPGPVSVPAGVELVSRLYNPLRILSRISAGKILAPKPTLESMELFQRTVRGTAPPLSTT